MEKEPEVLEGVVEDIIYKNDENGYTVARVELDDGGAITIVGAMPFLGAGEHISATGTYTVHPQHGPQFQVDNYLREMPADEAGIYAYLASRTVKGIGPKTAKLIVDRFGMESFDVLAEMPHRLAEIRGITLDKAKAIQEEFLRLNSMRMLLEFLVTHSLPTHFASSLMAAYGDLAAETVARDPYLLCEEPYLLDFGRADELATVSLGIPEDSALRLEAGILYVLTFNLQAGHTFVPRDKLLPAASRLLGWPEEELEDRLETLRAREKVKQDLWRGREVVYLEYVWKQEVYVSREITRLKQMPLKPPPDLEKNLKKIEARQGMEYAQKQREAICLPFTAGVTLITGGPGTGKTTALQTMIALLQTYGLNTLLAAPTGRAAKRMSQLCDREAKTIHRLLEPMFDKAGNLRFKKNKSDPLQADVIIVDEASMLELSLAASLLEALPLHGRLVLVGDADQLPPVGAGSFFADLLGVEALPRVRLTEIFRQAQDSDIVLNAHRFNRGEMPALRKNDRDFYFSVSRSADHTVDNVVSLMTQRIPGHFGIPQTEIQVICPSRQGMCGTENLNRLLQAALNPPAADKGETRFGETVFRTGDRVMQIRNNYDRIWTRLEPA
ncbi:MAG: AAA family ATPase, partial [Clostridia bacterium]|nr:AAA family ATPase [Clostridia bacterium]